MIDNRWPNIACTMVARQIWWFTSVVRLWRDWYDGGTTGMTDGCYWREMFCRAKNFNIFKICGPTTLAEPILSWPKIFVSGHYHAIVVSLNLEIDTQINPYWFIIHNNNNENYGKYDKKAADDCWKRLVRKELSWQDNWQRLFSAVVWSHQTGESFILILCKGKGETLNRGKYRGLKVTDQVMELLEWVLDSYIARNGKIVNIDEMQFTFVPGAIFVFHQIQEKYIAANKMFYFAFVDLEKAFDCVPRKILWWTLRSLGVGEWCVSVIQRMYMYSSAWGCEPVDGQYSEEFGLGVGKQQGYVLSPLLFYADELGLSRSVSTSSSRGRLAWKVKGSLSTWRRPNSWSLVLVMMS